MEEFNLPEDIQEELAKLKKREKYLTWIVAAFMVIAVFFGFKIYLSGSASAQYDNSAASYQTTTLGSGGSAGGGGCCGGGGAASGPKLSNDKLSAKALELFKKETGRTDGKAVVSDRGCHTQIDITDSKGTIIKSYGYKGGAEVYPIV